MAGGKRGRRGRWWRWSGADFARELLVYFLKDFSSGAWSSVVFPRQRMTHPKSKFLPEITNKKTWNGTASYNKPHDFNIFYQRFFVWLLGVPGEAGLQGLAAAIGVFGRALHVLGRSPRWKEDIGEDPVLWVKHGTWMMESALPNGS